MSVKRGSIILELSLPKAAAERLLSQESVKSILADLLKPISLLDIQRLEPKTVAPESTASPRFTEGNTVEAFVRDRLCGGITHHTAVGPGLARRAGQISGLGWHYLSAQNLRRQRHEVLVEDHLREALIRLNPDIAAQPDRADDVIYKLRAILMGVRSDGLVKANEQFAAWLTGERSMPFGQNGEHVTVHLIDFAEIERNQFVVTTQATYRAGAPRSGPTSCCSSTGFPW